MTTVQTALPSQTTPRRSSGLDTLLDALVSERRLLEDLTGILVRQRGSVTAGDLQGVEDSVFAVQRVLLTLGEARKRRHSLNVRMGYTDDISLRELFDALGPLATDTLRSAREALQGAARNLAREVAVNREVLRSALETSDEYVRILTGASAEKTGYGHAVRAAEGRPSSVLVNRQV